MAKQEEVIPWVGKVWFSTGDPLEKDLLHEIKFFTEVPMSEMEVRMRNYAAAQAKYLLGTETGSLDGKRYFGIGDRVIYWELTRDAV